LNADSMFRLVTGLHRGLYKASGGRLFGKMAGMPVVMLTTTGRKSGERRTTMLTAPVQDGDKVVLVASKGGYDHHPAWFLNLEANPDVEASIGGRAKKMRARVASPEEKADLWPRVTSIYKGYAGYQKKTERDIPLVILEPR